MTQFFKQHYTLLLLLSAGFLLLFFVLITIPKLIDADTDCYSTFGDLRKGIKERPQRYQPYIPAFNKAIKDDFISVSECSEIYDITNRLHKLKMLGAL